MEKEYIGSGAENISETECKNNEISLDELLASNKKYQSEYDKKVAQAMKTRLDNERKKWVKNVEKQNSIDELKSETIKQAVVKGIPLDFLIFNFEYETAETIKYKLDIIEKAVKSERERVINEYSEEKVLITG